MLIRVKDASDQEVIINTEQITAIRPVDKIRSKVFLADGQDFTLDMGILDARGLFIAGMDWPD